MVDCRVGRYAGVCWEGINTAPSSASDHSPTAMSGSTIAAKAKKSAPVKRDHPAYAEMIMSSIMHLKERNGSSRQAITKHVASNFNIPNPDKVQNNVRAALKKMTVAGKLVAGAAEGRKGAGCFKLAPAEKILRLKATKKASKPLKKAAVLKKLPKKAAKKKAVSKSLAAKKKKPSVKPGKKPAAKKSKPVSKKASK